MAKLTTDITVGISDELKRALDETRAELVAAKEALSEERIRALVREELIAAFSGMGPSSPQEPNPFYRTVEYGDKAV